MTGRAACLTLAVLYLGLAQTASAHRLDEYLQATRISIGLTGIGVEVDLTPGAAVAEKVFSMIDRDHDGTISAAEGAQYAQEFVSALTLNVDQAKLAPTLDKNQFPTLEEMRRGEGVIRLHATSSVKPVESGQHRITFTNTHRSDIGVYLVNALAPADDRIRITSQLRDPLQREFSMDYTVSAMSPSTVGTVVVLILLAGALGGIVWRLRREPSIPIRLRTGASSSGDDFSRRQ